MRKLYTVCLLVISQLFYWLPSNGQNCSVNAGVPIEFCPGEPMTLYGNVTGLFNGSTINWTQISGPAVVITSPNSLTTAAGTATGGATYVFRISSMCQDGITSTNDVTYTVITPPPAPPAANAGVDINAGCVPLGQSVPLNATPAPSGFFGSWSIVSGGTGSFSNINSPTATFTPTQQVAWVCPATTNSYVLRWTLVSTSPPHPQCPNSAPTTSDDVKVNLGMAQPVSARAIPPGCGNATSNTFLSGTCPGNGTPNWSLVSGPSGYSFTPVNAQNVTIANLQGGTYTFRYTV